MSRLIPTTVVALTLVATGLAGGCATESERSYRPTATVEEIMRTLIDPSADAIWDAVVTDATETGTVEIRPETNDDWAELRRHALTLAEATNLLALQGRQIAAPESRSQLPGIDLHPDAIQELVADNWEDWVDLTHDLHDTSVSILDAIESRDINALLVTGTELDLACENCHARYWYPGHSDPRPATNTTQ